MFNVRELIKFDENSDPLKTYRKLTKWEQITVKKMLVGENQEGIMTFFSLVNTPSDILEQIFQLKYEIIEKEKKKKKEVSG